MKKVLVFSTTEIRALFIFYEHAAAQPSQAGRIMLTIECWKDVHPALVAIPVDWDFPIPYGLMVDKNAPEDVRRFLALVENL